MGSIVITDSTEQVRSGLFVLSGEAGESGQVLNVSARIV